MTTRTRFPALAAAVAVATGAVAVDAGVSTPAARCPAASTSSGSGSSVATITEVLHSSVYADAKFVGTVPFAVAGGSWICSDGSGQAIFGLSPSGGIATCIVLPSTRLQILPQGSTQAVDFETGASWCVLRRGDVQLGASSRNVRRIVARTTTAIVGVVVSSTSTTVKVWSGEAVVYGRTTPVIVKRSAAQPPQQVIVSVTGTVRPGTASISALDKIAVAKLRLAQSKSPSS